MARAPIPFPAQVFAALLKLLGYVDKTALDYLRQIEDHERRLAALEAAVEEGFDSGFLLIPDGSLFLLPGGSRFLLPG